MARRKSSRRKKPSGRSEPLVTYVVEDGETPPGWWVFTFNRVMPELLPSGYGRHATAAAAETRAKELAEISGGSYAGFLE